MKGRVLQQYLQPKPGPAEADDPASADGPDDLGAFGFLRGTHYRALMLELRYKNGNIEGLPYAWLTRASFDPSEGITLRFGSEIIKIVGRNFNTEIRPNVRLFSAILRHRVPWIQQADQSSLLTLPPAAVVIEQINL
jgi:hypothetical protein